MVSPVCKGMRSAPASVAVLEATVHLDASALVLVCLSLRRAVDEVALAAARYYAPVNDARTRFPFGQASDGKD